MSQLVPLVVSDGLLVSTSGWILNFSYILRIWRCFKVWNNSLRVITLSLLLFLAEIGISSLCLFMMKYSYSFRDLSSCTHIWPPYRSISHRYIRKLSTLCRNFHYSSGNGVDDRPDGILHSLRFKAQHPKTRKTPILQNPGKYYAIFDRLLACIVGGRRGVFGYSVDWVEHLPAFYGAKLHLNSWVTLRCSEAQIN